MPTPKRPKKTKPWKPCYVYYTDERGDEQSVGIFPDRKTARHWQKRNLSVDDEGIAICEINLVPEGMKIQPPVTETLSTAVTLKEEPPLIELE